MENEERKERHSRALEPELISDPQKKAEAEALNGLRQYDFAVQLSLSAIERGSFKLRLSHVLSLHREALQGVSSYAGNFRPSDVEIEGSRHNPVGAHLVPELVEDLCDYVNDNWNKASAVHLASYVMWRLNWIHPFADGNGRTSRILSFVVLSIKIEAVLPGTPTLPDLIVDHRAEYEDALDAADDAWKADKIDVSRMEELVSGLLARQLTNVYQLAGGTT
ncbi:MAG TPA: Fic family protein [Bradyrhizobium sp.]